MPDEIPGSRHSAPDLEEMLPDLVAGRAMTKASHVGADVFDIATAAEAQANEADLARLGLSLADVSRAAAGRSDVDDDPPYFVMAYRFAGVRAETLPMELGIDRADAGSWTRAIVGGKPVLVGTDDMLVQSEHVLGRPYVYNVDDVRFIVATDDEAWAADALSDTSRTPRLLSDGSEWLNCEYVGEELGHLSCLREIGHDGFHIGRHLPCSSTQCDHTKATGARHQVSRDYFVERPVVSGAGSVEYVPISRDAFLCPFYSPAPGHLACLLELGHAGDHKGVLIGCGPEQCDHLDDILIDAEREPAEFDELLWLILSLSPDQRSALGDDPDARKAIAHEAHLHVRSQQVGSRRTPAVGRSSASSLNPVGWRWLWLLIAAVSFAVAGLVAFWRWS